MRTLLCDDHALFANALAPVLATRGHDVRVVLQPDSLAEAMTSHQPDLALLDVNFGGVSRYDLARTARAAWAPAAVALLTGVDDQTCWDLYDAGHVDGLIAKTVSLDPLAVSLVQIATGRRVVAGFRRPGGENRDWLTGGLTPREREVLELVAEGLTNGEVSRRLDLSANTVRSHVQHLLEKLHVHHRMAAVAVAWERGLLPERPHRTGVDAYRGSHPS